MHTEPALIVGAVEAVLIVAIAFGLDVSPEQLAAIVAALIAIGAVVTRSKVSPVDPDA